MPRKCEVCNKEAFSHPELSFHRFPSDIERKKIWASLLGFESVDFSKKLVFICSDHFTSKDIATKANKTKRLKQDANPLPYWSFETSHSSEETITDEEVAYYSQVKEMKPSREAVEIDDINSTTMASPVTVEEMLASTDFNRNEPETRKRLRPSNSRKNSKEASEIDDMSSEKMGAKNQSNIRQARKISLKGKDFSTPYKVEKNFLALKEIVESQRKMIDNLQSKVLWLERTVETLNEKLSIKGSSENMAMDNAGLPCDEPDILNISEMDDKSHIVKIEIEDNFISTDQSIDVKPFATVGNSLSQSVSWSISSKNGTNVKPKDENV